MPKTIFTSLSPNTELDDVLLSLSLLFQPWKWQKGQAVRRLEKTFQKWLPIKYAFTFSSGRGGLYAILSSLDLKKDDEVLMQAYTCLAVPNPVVWVGAQPVYVDIDRDTLAMSPEDLKKKITKQSKVIIIQHTFGQPAHLDQLISIARKYNLIIIEDCAHALGSQYKGKKIGRFGDVSFFSFGRDKVISSVFGGLVATNDKKLALKIKAFQKTKPLPKKGWILQQLLQPIVTSTAKLLYNFLALGKIILAVTKQGGIISKSVLAVEKKAGQPDFLTNKMPNALALLALRQFKKLDKFNNHRKTIAALYYQQLEGFNYWLPQEITDSLSIYLRYNLQTDQTAKIRQMAKNKDILLGDWYNCPVAPSGIDYQSIFYQPGSCPMSEKVAKMSLNLPTDIHISKQDALRITSFLRDFK